MFLPIFKNRSEVLAKKDAPPPIAFAKSQTGVAGKTPEGKEVGAGWAPEAAAA
jgi:hypothetical protein